MYRFEIFNADGNCLRKAQVDDFFRSAGLVLPKKINIVNYMSGNNIGRTTSIDIDVFETALKDPSDHFFRITIPKNSDVFDSDAKALIEGKGISPEELKAIAELTVADQAEGVTEGYWFWPTIFGGSLLVLLGIYVVKKVRS